MGIRLAKALREASKDSGKQLKDLAKATGLSSSLLSEYHSNKRNPSFGSLAQLADGYALPYSRVVRLWLEDQTETQQEIDRLASEVFVQRDKAPPSPHIGLIDSLVGSRDVHRAAEKVLEQVEKSKRLIDTSAHEILTALNNIPSLQVLGGRTAAIISASSDDWRPIQGNSECKKRTVFVAKRPTPVLAELHCIPPRMGGLHRQADFPSRPAYYELWSVVQGEGILLVQREKIEEGWDQFDAMLGFCGYYWSANRHVWLNVADNTPLILFHLFYPYRQSDMKPGGCDEACEFEIKHVETALPVEVASEVQKSIRKWRPSQQAVQAFQGFAASEL